MKEKNKRRTPRFPATVSSFIRKDRPEGGYSLMQFVSKDLSEGGIFIVTDDLTLFDLNEEVTIIVERGREHYFEGTAKVVRSARIFGTAGALTESGYGLMFIDPDEQFLQAINSEIKTAKPK